MEINVIAKILSKFSKISAILALFSLLLPNLVEKIEILA